MRILFSAQNVEKEWNKDNVRNRHVEKIFFTCLFFKKIS